MASDPVSDPVLTKSGRLRGWKEIGRWFGVDERTVKRWEATRGLPIRRVPGEARAPVFAYEAELKAWMAAAEVAEEAPAAAHVGTTDGSRLRQRGLLLALGAGVLLLAAALWLGIGARREADARLADVRQLAHVEVAQISEQLERQPGTVQARAALAVEAARVLERVAGSPGASPELRREAAEAWRRLAIVQNSVDRSSLGDRPAARQSLEKALALVADDRSVEGGRLRARLLIEAARQAAGGGDADKAPAMLEVAGKALDAGAPAWLREELALATSEVAGWRADYAGAKAAAEPVTKLEVTDAASAVRRVRAEDLRAEALFYAGDMEGALEGYARAEAAARDGGARWPDDPRLRWAQLRALWNVGSTLIDLKRPEEAARKLSAALAGWLALEAGDREDGSVLAWVRTARMSYGLALAEAGQTDEAVTQLRTSVAERRAWLARAPDDVDRQRPLVTGLAALGDVLAPAGRREEACALYEEAGAVAARMASAGSLSLHDRQEMMGKLEASRGRWCRAGG